MFMLSFRTFEEENLNVLLPYVNLSNYLYDLENILGENSKHFYEQYLFLITRGACKKHIYKRLMDFYREKKIPFNVFLKIEELNNIV